MRILIYKRAASLVFPCRAPGAAVVISLRSVPIGNNPCDPFDMTELAFLYHFTDLLIYGVSPLVIHYSEKLTAFFRSVVHFFDLLRINAGRLFGQYVKTVFKRFYRQRWVIIVRDRYQNSVAKSAFIHFFGVIKHAFFGI